MFLSFFLVTGVGDVFLVLSCILVILFSCFLITGVTDVLIACVLVLGVSHLHTTLLSLLNRSLTTVDT